MKKAFKILGYFVLILVVILLLGAGFINFGGIPTYPVEMSESLKNLSVPKDSISKERGQRIAAMLCMKCHLGEDRQLSGKLVADIPKEFGSIYSKNITNDKLKGIGKWTDGQLVYYIKTGVKFDGTYSPPYMPKFPLMADRDIQSIVAWLRSDYPEVQASQIVQPMNQPNFLVKLLCRVVMKPLPVQDVSQMPDSNNKVAFGKYLSTGVLGCFQCHSADFKTNNEIHPEKSVGFFGGGNPMLDMDGNVVKSLNITPDKQSGIGNYTEQQFTHLLQTGQRADGSQVRYPMEIYHLLTDHEIQSIYAYLQTVPAIRNEH